MLIGLIMFISIFKSEIYHKLRSTSSSLEPSFSFQYGQSFILYVFGFLFVELAGILNICLFNKFQKEVENFNQVCFTFHQKKPPRHFGQTNIFSPFSSSLFSRTHTQNRLLNNMTIKHDQVDISNNHPPPRIAFSSSLGNG
jgi:hypothetical protein